MLDVNHHRLYPFQNSSIWKLGDTFKGQKAVGSNDTDIMILYDRTWVRFQSSRKMIAQIETKQ